MYQECTCINNEYPGYIIAFKTDWKTIVFSILSKDFTENPFLAINEEKSDQIYKHKKLAAIVKMFKVTVYPIDKVISIVYI